MTQLSQDDIARITERLIEGLRPIVEREVRQIAQREVATLLPNPFVSQQPSLAEIRRPLTNLDIGDVLSSSGRYIPALGGVVDYCMDDIEKRKGFTNQPLTAPLPLTAEDAFRCASFGIECEPTRVPVTVDRDCPNRVIFVSDPLDPLDLEIWDRAITARRNAVRDGGALDEVLLISDNIIASIERSPWSWAPTNSYYQKSHINAPGTVRAWFRQMRAWDCVRDISFATDSWGALAAVRPHLRPWTLFDTQQVIDRETRPKRVTGITPEDVQRFIREDDADRSRRMRPILTIKGMDANGTFYFDVPNTPEIAEWLAGVEYCEWDDWPAYVARRPWTFDGRKPILREEDAHRSDSR